MIQTYIIHRGHKNQKIRGKLKVVIDSQTGKRFLSGDELVKTLHWKDREGRTNVDEVFLPIRIEITGCTVTIK